MKVSKKMFRKMRCSMAVLLTIVLAAGNLTGISGSALAAMGGSGKLASASDASEDSGEESSKESASPSDAGSSGASGSISSGSSGGSSSGASGGSVVRQRTATPSVALLDLEDEEEGEPFEIWFNEDGKTSVKKGMQQENPYVYSMSDMAAKTNSITYNGEKYYTVQGSVNPQPVNKIPLDGDAAMYVIAPDDGTITFYGICSAGKTFYMSVAESIEETTAENEVVASGDGGELVRTVSVEKGNVVYTYCTGSKLQFAGFVYELPKVATTIPLTLEGEELGEAKITFSNGITDDVTVGADAEEITLTTGYVYTVTIDSPQLIIDLEEVDLTESTPDSITIQVSPAPVHSVSGSIQGLPEGVTVEKLVYTDAGGAAVEAEVTDGAYTVELKNGTYTASADVSDSSYEVYDHVEVTGIEGEAISNDVWFYGPETVYSSEYQAKLLVGSRAGCDYPTIREAVAAAAAMDREEDDDVTIVLCDDDYFEQVIINTPNIKLEAAEGVEPTIRWYYGIGYKYYSIGSNGYFDQKAANDQFEKNFAVKWGATVNLQSKAAGFSAEGIQFINTFNQYVTDEEIEDGAEVITAEEYGQSVSGSLGDRISTDLDVADTKNVERAAALVCDADQAEFYQCTFLSSQDTLYTGTGRQYYRDCTIIGQTDYIFGNTGTKCIFDNCELRWLGYTGGSSKAGYITATRGDYLFRGCTVTANDADGYQVTPGYFGRPWGTAAAVTFIATAIEDGTMNPDGWYEMSGVKPENATFREYGNYILNPEYAADQSNFFYTSYSTSDLTFRLSKAEAEALAGTDGLDDYLVGWVPEFLLAVPIDLSGVDGWSSGDTEKVWKFTYFGASSSASVNTIGEGSAIDGTVVLNSCTYNAEGSIDKKGGKFVADSPADGISLYYTTINPAEENFRLQADVTIDYMNPAPDGQEGFAVMIRDMIGNHGETASFLSNLVSVTATKLPSDAMNGAAEVKDMIGVRDYTGIRNPANLDDAPDYKVYRQGFDENGTKVEQGATYRVSLEKTDYAYITSQYEILADGSTGDKLGEHILYIPAADADAQTVTSYSELSDPMLVQDAEKAYVGFAAARGMNVTFSNIEFTTSSWNASNWMPQETLLVEPEYQITSPATCAENTYTLVFKANADGTAVIYQDGVLADQNVKITAGAEFSKAYTMPTEADSSTFKVEFTPDPDYRPSAFEELSSYEMAEITRTVTKRTLGNGSTIYVKPDGAAANNGTSYDDAVDFQTALDYATAGQTILLQAGKYDMSGKSLTVARGRDGSENEPILVTGDGGYATLDFGRSGSGLTAWGNYWNFSFINITGTKDGVKGMQLSGSYCILERMNFYNNGNTGLQVSGSSAETIEKWPSYNTILNCTSMNNADEAMEDADGFAAKLTSGVGNVFDGCIAAYNADDGWDFFAKVATGSIGAVTIQNSVAYRNGYLLTPADSTKANWSFSDIYCDEDGTLTYDSNATLLDAGNGNGFKMGGSNMPGNHKLKNSIAYENKAKGFDSNSCTDIKIYDSTSYNNESYNVAMYTSDKSAVTDYEADGILSFRKGTSVKEQIAPQTQSSAAVYGATNYYWDTDTNTSHNTAASPVTASEDWFISLDTSVEPERNEDGSINMHGLLLLSDLGLAASEDQAGARGKIWGQEETEKATIWVVGDSTVSAFSDAYYIPREGYGEELSSYLNATVYNLARSGASSKDFTTMENYEILLNGSETVPALGNAEGAKFLVIGFGHNDEKTEAARYTNPNGDYQTEGSFAHSLYTNYIKPALDAGVTPIVCTPIVRLTDENTAASYNSASGHITETTVIEGVVFEGGDYAQAIRRMCEDLNLDCIDLTEETKNINVELGDGAQWMHSFTGAKYGEDGVTLVASGLDKTHTNRYGAKMNAWLIANADSALRAFSKGKVRPSYAADFGDAINPDYEVSDYKSPTEPSALWPAFTDADGTVWYGSVFGDVGGQDKISPDNFIAEISGDSITLGVANNRGKVASGSEGMMMYYVQLPAGTAFTLTADAAVNTLAANNQVSFGLMARDDMYIDTYVSKTMGDYVAAGTRNQGAFNCFGRKSGLLYDGPAAEKVYGEGDTLSMKIVGTADGYTLTYGDNQTVSAGFDYALTSIDSDYIYVGFYVVRNCNITFSNLSLKVEEIQQEDDKNDTSELEAALEAAAALSESSYTAASWKALAEAMAIAQAVLASENSTQDEINQAVLLVNQAMFNLVKISGGSSSGGSGSGDSGSGGSGSGDNGSGGSGSGSSTTSSSSGGHRSGTVSSNPAVIIAGSGTVTASDSAESGTWTSVVLESGQVIWSFSGEGGPIINRWAYVQNPYRIGNQPEFGWFYFDAAGIMKTGWFTDADGYVYYLLPDSDGSQGLMLTGWQLIGGKYYYFSTISGTPLGSMLTDTTTPDGYYVGEDGSWNEQ